MKLTMKLFKAEQRVDICDEYGNVIRRKHFNDPTIDIGTVIGCNAFVQGYCEGWAAARQAIGNCEASERMVDVEAMNVKEWK